MVDRCMRMDSSRCDSSRITLDLLSQVIRLGSQLEESVLMYLSTIRFSLSIECLSHLSEKDTEERQKWIVTRKCCTTYLVSTQNRHTMNIAMHHAHVYQ